MTRDKISTNRRSSQRRSVPFITASAVSLLLLSTLSGCVIFAPFIQAWRNVGASESDRIALLGQQIKRFGEALYWGKGEAALFVDKEATEDVRKGLNIDREDLRVVETKIKNIEYEQEAYLANVEFVVRYYRVPYYVVSTAKETHVWKFRLGDNWKLLKRETSVELKK